MTDQPQYHLTITLPTVVTTMVWQTYNDGRQAYIKAETSPNVVLADYYGALALIHAQFIKVDTDYEPLKTAIMPENNQKTTPMDIVALIVMQVSQPVEKTVNIPLVDLLSRLNLTSKSSDTASTQTDTLSPTL